MSDRILPFENILNFRDFGGYGTNCGNVVQGNKLFRSAHLNLPSESDLTRLKALDIGLVVDLRHEPERVRQPSQWPDGKPAITLTYPDAQDGVSKKIAPHEAFMQNDLMTGQDARDYMVRSYGARPDDDGFKEIFSDTLHHMVKTGDGILVHCTAGKDRTGTLVAIIQAALGVDRKTIMDDFMLTMQAVDIDNFIGLAALNFTKRFGRKIEAEALRPMFGVEEIYLESALNTIENMDTYIREDLGFSDQDRSRLKSIYLSA